MVLTRRSCFDLFDLQHIFANFNYGETVTLKAEGLFKNVPGTYLKRLFSHCSHDGGCEDNCRRVSASMSLSFDRFENLHAVHARNIKIDQNKPQNSNVVFTNLET